MTPSQAPPPEPRSGDQEEQHLYTALHHDADAMLARDGDPTIFAVWALAAIRRQPTRELRSIAADAVMAAMDDDEARRR